MRFVSIRADDGSLHPGIVTERGIVPLSQAASALGMPAPASIVEVLATEAATPGTISRLADAAAGMDALPDTLALGPAIANPPKLFCLAGNYQSHLTEGGGQGVNKAEITPRFFMKPNTAIVGTGDPIRIPVVSETVDYEIEIAAVIGTGGKEIPLEVADSHVAGYVVFNDISARHLKGLEHRIPRHMDDFFDWLVGKWCDSFAVVGPYLVTRDEIPDPTHLEMSLHVNGELRQHSSAGEMILTVPEAIAWISRFLTLEPGDLICMGTPGGVGETTQTYLKPGDEIVGAIEHLGKIANPVV
ncbi:MAG: fumarylacetoacetate hydrolase family protein [Thermomicrobiales bacterium]